MRFSCSELLPEERKNSWRTNSSHTKCAKNIPNQTETILHVKSFCAGKISLCENVRVLTHSNALCVKISAKASACKKNVENLLCMKGICIITSFCMWKRLRLRVSVCKIFLVWNLLCAESFIVGIGQNKYASAQWHCRICFPAFAKNVCRWTCQPFTDSAKWLCEKRHC
jgi:hypothetical protein